jgi:hypothetical protein
MPLHGQPPSIENLPRRKLRSPPAHARPKHLVHGSANRGNNTPDNKTDEGSEERPFGDIFELFTPSQENPECDDAYRRNNE